MHDFCRGEPVEVRGRGDRVGPDIFRIDEIADRELRELAESVIVSNASQVGPKTAEMWRGPSLNASTG